MVVTGDVGRRVEGGDRPLGPTRVTIGGRSRKTHDLERVDVKESLPSPVWVEDVQHSEFWLHTLFVEYLVFYDILTSKRDG